LRDGYERQKQKAEQEAMQHTFLLNLTFVLASGMPARS